MIIHMEKYYLDEGGDDEDATIIVYCGKRALIHPNGETTPAGFDFVIPPDPRGLCDCDPCKVSLAAQVAANEERKCHLQSANSLERKQTDPVVLT